VAAGRAACCTLHPQIQNSKLENPNRAKSLPSRAPSLPILPFTRGQYGNRCRVANRSAGASLDLREDRPHSTGIAAARPPCLRLPCLLRGVRGACRVLDGPVLNIARRRGPCRRGGRRRSSTKEQGMGEATMVMSARLTWITSGSQYEVAWTSKYHQRLVGPTFKHNARSLPPSRLNPRNRALAIIALQTVASWLFSRTTSHQSQFAPKASHESYKPVCIAGVQSASC
jgi:hypothetical protein